MSRRSPTRAGQDPSCLRAQLAVVDAALEYGRAHDFARRGRLTLLMARAIEYRAKLVAAGRARRSDGAADVPRLIRAERELAQAATAFARAYRGSTEQTRAACRTAVLQRALDYAREAVR